MNCTQFSEKYSHPIYFKSTEANCKAQLSFIDEPMDPKSYKEKIRELSETQLRDIMDKLADNLKSKAVDLVSLRSQHSMIEAISQDAGTTRSERAVCEKGNKVLRISMKKSVMNPI